MRTSIRIGLVVAAAAMLGQLAALGGQAVEAGSAAATPVERLLPANTVAFVQVANLPELGAAFEKSALAEAIQGSPVLSYLRVVAGAAAELGAVVLTGQPTAELRSCLGQNAAIALLDFKDAADAKQRVPIVLLVEATDPKKLDSILTAQLQLFSLLRGELTLSERQHAGATVREVALPKGGSLAWCLRENFLIVGSPDSTNSLLDHLGAKGPSITTFPAYQAVHKQIPTTAGLTAYVNGKALLEKSAVQNNPAELQKLRAAGLADAQALGLAIDFQRRQVRERLYLHTGGQATGLIKLLTQGPPITPTAAQFIPPTYTVCLSMGLNEVGLWDRVRTMIVDAAGEPAASFLDTAAAQVQQNIGVQIKEGFLDTFGEELFAGLDLSQLGKFLGTGREPKPEELPFIVGARLRNAPALTQTLDLIAANEALFEKGVTRTRAKHGDVDLYTFRIPVSTEIQPSYAILDNVFLFSIRPEAVAAAIDAAKSKKSFAATPAQGTHSVANVSPSGAPAHVRLYVNDAQLLATFLGLIRQEVPESARWLLPELDKLFAGLHGYHVILRREPQGVVLTTLSDLSSLGTLAAVAVIMDQFHAIVARRVEADFEAIAVALEKYRAKNNAYPDTLDPLVPDYLPSIPQDRFEPKRPYGYTRGRPGPDGKVPDAWLLVSVGPDKKPDIPIELFDPPAWRAKLETQDPAEIGRLKALIYQFRKDQYPDERKNDDEGDLFRMGGPDAALPQPPRKAE